MASQATKSISTRIHRAASVALLRPGFIVAMQPCRAKHSIATTSGGVANGSLQLMPQSAECLLRQVITAVMQASACWQDTIMFVMRRYAVGCAETATQLRRMAGRAVRPIAASVLRFAFGLLRRGHRRMLVRRR